MQTTLKRFVAIALATSLIVSVLSVVDHFTQNAPAAQAANAAEFDPGNIMSDSVFYNKATMTVDDIQRFLNAQVPNCRAGYTCLKDYWQTTTYQSAKSEGCAAYGGQNESAARIIYKVATACGINPQVLLVLLEKEQGLVSDDWPSDRQYRSATGYGCPDTADCDINYYGFFNQLYNAAWQFKKYQARPLDRGYIAGRTNTIRWSPNAACGSSQVYIQNQATAGLYVYTPYRPNQAALNNLYGTGDGCSAYGNRNFWRIFTDWFGSTKGFQVHGQIQALYSQSAGGMGQPVAAAVAISGGGVQQQFQKGMAYWHPSTGAAFVAGAILNNYLYLGGPTGRMGYPIGAEAGYPGNVSLQRFQNGWLVWSAAAGTHVISGAIGARFVAMGAGATWLAYPLAGEESVPGGTKQRFKGGTIYWSSATGAWEITAAMEAGYLVAGGPTGLYKFPTGPATNHGNGEFSQPFSGRVLNWSTSRGALLNPTVSQIGGTDRFATAVAISKSGFPSTAPVVVVATAGDFPDALAAAPAAAKLGGPLLLTEAQGLNPATEAEIVRLRPQKVVIVGGTGVVSAAVESRLTQLVPTVERWAGADRFATANVIARNAFSGGAATAYLATGWDFPDALAAAGAAGSIDAPVLLVDGKAATIDPATQTLLQDLGTTKVNIGGASAVVSSGIESSIAASGRTVVRQGGADRYLTAQAINTAAFGSANRIYLATGALFPDALAGAAIAGANSAPLYLVRGSCIPESALWEINRLKTKEVVLLGGTGTLDSNVLRLSRC